MCVMGQRRILESNIEPRPKIESERRHDQVEGGMLQHSYRTHPATEALIHAEVLHSKRRRRGLASGTTISPPTHRIKTSGKGRPLRSDRLESRLSSKTLSTESCSSSSSSSSSNSSDEDQSDSTCFAKNIEYLEHLSIRRVDPSCRGLVRSMAIRENLCDLSMRDNHHYPVILKSLTPNTFVGALPSAHIEPLVALETDTTCKTRQIGEDRVSLDPVASKDHSSRSHPLLRQHPSRLS